MKRFTLAKSTNMVTRRYAVGLDLRAGELNALPVSRKSELENPVTVLVRHPALYCGSPQEAQLWRRDTLLEMFRNIR